MDEKIREFLETEKYELLDTLIEDVSAAASVWPDSVRARLKELQRDGFVRITGYRNLPGRRWRWFPGGWNSSVTVATIERKRTE